LKSKIYKKDIEDYKNHLEYELNKQNRENKPATKRTQLSVIKSLFTYCEIDLPTSFWQRINNYKNSTASKTDTPTPEQLRKIFDNTDLQGRCLFGIMKDSGSRISSVILLKHKDIDINKDFPIITFYYKNVKNGITKKKCITHETKHFLESYFEKHKFKPDDKIFPMTRQNANYKWNCAIEKTNLKQKDTNTNRLTMTTHCLKRFFKVYTSNIDKTLCDYFCEHGNLNDRYYQLPDNLLQKEYSKLSKTLLIYERAYDIDKRIEQLQKESNEKTGQIKILRDKTEQLNSYENRLKQIEKQLDINLNPNNKQTLEGMKFMEKLTPLIFKRLTGRFPTKEENNNMIEAFRNEMPKILDEINMLPTTEQKLNNDITDKIIMDRIKQITKQ